MPYISTVRVTGIIYCYYICTALARQFALDQTTVLTTHSLVKPHDIIPKSGLPFSHSLSAASHAPPRHVSPHHTSWHQWHRVEPTPITASQAGSVAPPPQVLRQAECSTPSQALRQAECSTPSTSPQAGKV